MYIIFIIFFFFFFFQAEDGIRDTSVTGVQTCALPIYRRSTISHPRVLHPRVRKSLIVSASRIASQNTLRSEERRVGKECRTGRGRGNEKKKKKMKKN